MQFEFDPEKSQTNFEKHGIDFVQAQKLWRQNVFEYEVKTYPWEKRFLVIGMIDEIYWTAVVTYRNGTIRIISVRKARDDEKRQYNERN